MNQLFLPSRDQNIYLLPCLLSVIFLAMPLVEMARSPRTARLVLIMTDTGFLSDLSSLLWLQHFGWSVSALNVRSGGKPRKN